MKKNRDRTIQAQKENFRHRISGYIKAVKKGLSATVRFNPTVLSCVQGQPSIAGLSIRKDRWNLEDPHKHNAPRPGKKISKLRISPRIEIAVKITSIIRPTKKGINRLGTEFSG